MSKAMVLLSGGMDSATALWFAKTRFQVYALSFEYRGRNRNEIRAARRLGEKVDVEKHLIVDVSFLKQISELAESRRKLILEKHHVPSTYIPSRNTVFFGIASHFSEITGAKCIITGHSLIDPFLDAKPAYVNAINTALSYGSWMGRKYQAKIIMPFSKLDKTGILRLALKLKVPLELTWSCHKDGKIACGRCEGCVSRLEAFKNLGVDDKIRYRNTPTISRQSPKNQSNLSSARDSNRR